MIVVCEHCGKEFKSLPHEKRKYCSRKCNGERRRGVTGPGIGRPRRDPAERFWERVDRSNPDGCWFWLGALTWDGYGKFGNDHAHRTAWELTYGPIPEGQHACHSCDASYPVGDITYRRCVRPDHLFLGTNAENTADKISKGRDCRGEASPSAKLTADDVEAIRSEYAAGQVRQRDLAKRFGVSRSQIGNIVRGDAWRQPEVRIIPVPTEQASGF